MVRLVFRPYTQIRRTICTSVSLRASTRVSPGFTLFRHRSPSFGSQQICSYSNLPQVTDRSIVHSPIKKSSYLSEQARLYFHYASGFSTQILAYMLDSLVRVSRRVGKNHFGKIARSTLRPHAHRRTQTTRRIGPGLGSLCGCATSFCLTTENKPAASPCASRSLMKCWQPAMDRQKSPFTAEE